MAATQKMKGTIKTLKKPEGFGFINHTATGDDYFFHRSSMEVTSPRAFNDLDRDDQVEFTPTEGPKGLRAIQVRTTR